MFLFFRMNEFCEVKLKRNAHEASEVAIHYELQVFTESSDQVRGTINPTLLG